MVYVELFLTEAEKDRVSKWESKSEDQSLATRILNPFWDTIARQVPDHVAPNVLSIAGVLCLIQAYYLCYMYMPLYPRAVSIAVVLLAFIFQTLDAIDGKHATNTKNRSPVGELFSQACDNIGATFLMLTLCNLLGINDTSSQWYIVQAAQLFFMQKHITAFLSKGVLTFGVLSSPGEVVFLFAVVGIVRSVIGFQWLSSLWYSLGLGLYPVAITIYGGVWIYTLLRVFAFPPEHVSTRNGLAFSLFYRLFPAIVLEISVGRAATTEFDIIVDGVFIAMLTSDLIVGKMAQRELHPWLVVFAMLSIFHNLATLMLSVFYYTAVFSDLCYYMKLPLFTINRNVYVCGVYDLCHLGHMRSFENALKFGTRLFVGVSNDEDCTGYKRKPIMTHKERCDAVAACKYVSKVIPNAPLLTPKEFINQHDIHVVALSEEYDKPEDIYYHDAREMGITKILPRTQGMSTSDLLKRMTEYAAQKK